MKSKIIFLMFIALLCAIACSDPNNPGSDQTLELGSITGKAVFKGSASHSGIVITLERTDGLRSASVAASAGRSAIASSVASSTVTAEDGSYRFDGIASAMYTVYATSRNAKERAVAVNVPVFPGQVSPAEELSLTLVGGLSGNVAVAGGAGNAGVLVFIASTSYMAVTDNAGNFLIGDVPVSEQGYQIIAMKGNYTTVLGTFSVSAGAVTDLGTLALEIPASNGVAAGIQWKGSLGSAPSNPEVNWAYYDMLQRKSFIWDGTAWRVIAQDGEQGIQGEQGSAGATGGHGISIVWKGALYSAPENPQSNWAYYDIAQKASFIWDGNAWQFLSKDGADGNDGENGNGGQSDSRIFTRTVDLISWLGKQQGGNTPNNPVYVAYAGNESPAVLFNALGTVHKYIDLDFSLSGYLEFNSGNEAGRKYIVSLVLPRDYRINSGTESDSTFKYFENLVSVSGTIPMIGAYAFCDLNNLQSVSFSKSGSFSNKSFFKCNNLSTVNLPKQDQLTVNPFVECAALKTLELPELRWLYEYAFSDFTSLVSLYLPKVEEIERGAFRNCTSLTSIIVGNRIPQLNENIFYGAARTPRTITFYVIGATVNIQWDYGLGGGYFWDLNSPYRDNITVDLKPY